MEKAKLPRRGLLLDHLLVPMRSFNTTNTHSMVKIKINKQSFLVGHELCLIWRFLEGQR